MGKQTLRGWMIEAGMWPFEPPPKAIWLRACDYPTAVAERLIRWQAVRVAEFLKDPEQAVLILAP